MGRRKQTKEEKMEIVKNAVENFKNWDAQRNDRTMLFAQCEEVKYWFVANKNDVVVSFYETVEPKYLNVYENAHGYKYVTTKVNGKTKKFYIYRMQAKVFDVYAYGKAKKYESLEGLEVHHTEADKRNEPEAEEILEPNTHDKLFDKRIIPGLNDDEKKHFEYVQRVIKVVEENTPDQDVVLFPGTGVVNGEETKDLTQVIYADDFAGVTDLVASAVEKMNEPKLTVFEKDEYVVLYPGVLFTHTVISKFNKEIMEHIKRADQKEHMEENTKYPITIKCGMNKFEILVMKKVDR